MSTNSTSNPISLLDKISSNDNFLIVQDVDGVCIPLVKDPLCREITLTYIESVRKMNGHFFILTNGEHGGERGLNKVIERAYIKSNKQCDNCFYLPGLAAGGIEFQDEFGQISFPGISKKELMFLSQVPKEMATLLGKGLERILPDLNTIELKNLTNSSILDTRFSPTINLNKIFSCIPNDLRRQVEIQLETERVMSKIIDYAVQEDLASSFFLHIAPNLGVSSNGKDIIKTAQKGDVGTTDIQLMISGSIKEAGLLVLINKYVQRKFGRYPFGKDFNARKAPRSMNELISICKEEILPTEMPILIGVGDTVTSTRNQQDNGWLRGGSDRGFLTLIQELGKEFKKQNIVLLVDSSKGEVDRPNLEDHQLKGITDPEDQLRFTSLFIGGPDSYMKWFKELANRKGNSYSDKKK